VNPNAICESGSQFPAGRKSDGLDFLKQSLRDLCPRLNEGGEAEGYDFASAIRIAAEELADREMKDDLTACTRNISQRSLIPAVDLR
jgi:hypothetical protein